MARSCKLGSKTHKNRKQDDYMLLQYMICAELSSSEEGNSSGTQSSD